MEKERTKSNPPTSVITYTETIRSTQTFRDNFPGGSESIKYSAGPRKQDGHCVWKACTHKKSMCSPVCIARSHVEGYRPDYSHRGSEDAFVWAYPPTGAVPAGSWDDECLLGCLAQLDLNISESSLIYSGVIQALPALGGVVRFNRIMRDVARHVSRGMRKQPFTTVLKNLISADFINRFVIGPTLNDMHTFQHACDHVLNIINTMHERNAAPFALESSSTRNISSSTTATSWRPAYSLCRFHGYRKSETSVTSQAFMRVTARYDTKAVSPFKMWATRVGYTRPLDSLWDLVPFSFVVDYFTRAGDFIAGLSDEMSRQEGLVGKIGCINALWGACKRTISLTTEVTSITRPGNGYYSNPRVETYMSGPCSQEFYVYDRFPIGNAGTVINMLNSSTDFIDVKLSSTRKRTLAELITQYRLSKRR